MVSGGYVGGLSGPVLHSAVSSHVGTSTRCHVGWSDRPLAVSACSTLVVSSDSLSQLSRRMNWSSRSWSRQSIRSRSEGSSRGEVRSAKKRAYSYEDTHIRSLLCF